MNIPRKLQGISILLYQYRPIPPLEEMANPCRLSIKVVGITGVQMMEDSVEIPFWGLQEEMVMIRHEAETMDSGSISLRCRSEVAKKSLIISF
jgi:hypothetical protein